MNDSQVKEMILKALRAHGSMTSHELEAVLKMEWTSFSAQLIAMIRNTFNPTGEIGATRVQFRGTVYHLPDQTP